MVKDLLLLTVLLFVPQQDRLPKKQMKKETHNEFHQNVCYDSS